MIVNIRYLTGPETLSINFDEKQKIATLKAEVGKLHHMEISDFHLVFGGAVLSDERTLESYNYISDLIVFVIFKNTGVVQLQVAAPLPTREPSEDNDNNNNNNNNNNNEPEKPYEYTTWIVEFDADGNLTRNTTHECTDKSLWIENGFNYTCSDDGLQFIMVTHGKALMFNIHNHTSIINRSPDGKHILSADLQATVLLNFLGLIMNARESMISHHQVFLQRVRDLGAKKHFVTLLGMQLKYNLPKNPAAYKILVDGFKDLLNDRVLLAELTSNLQATDPFVLRERGLIEFDAKKNPNWFVYPPNALVNSARVPALTVDSFGKLAIYKGKPKSEGVSKKVYIINCCGDIDVEMDTDHAMKVITELSIEIPGMEEIPVSEITIVCIDTSLSMDDPLDEAQAEEIQSLKDSFKPLTTPISLDDVVPLLEKWDIIVDDLRTRNAKLNLMCQVLAGVFKSHDPKCILTACETYLKRDKPSVPKEEKKKYTFKCMFNRFMEEVQCDDIEKEKEAYFARQVSASQQNDYQYFVNKSDDVKMYGMYSGHVLARKGIDTDLIFKFGSRLKTFKAWQPVSDLFIFAYHELGLQSATGNALTIWHSLRKVDGRSFGDILDLRRVCLDWDFSSSKDANELQVTKKPVIADDTYRAFVKAQEKKLVSKMLLAKIMFNSYVDRLSAYDLPHALGLVKFGDTVEVAMPVSQSIEVFRNSVNNLTAAGNTALHDSVMSAVELIKNYKGKKQDNVVTRVIVLTDGVDTCSKTTHSMMNAALRKNGIWLDVVSLGSTEEGRSCMHAFLGDGFFVKNERDVIDLVESETFLSLALRDKKSCFYSKSEDYNNNNNNNNNNLDKKINVNKFIEEIKKTQELCAPLVKDQFKSKANASALGVNITRRLMTELKLCNDTPHAGYTIKTKLEDSLSEWDVTFIGPEGTPYEGHKFNMMLVVDAEYPFKAPKCRFYPPSVLHANISMHGRVCHSVLDRNWTPSTTMVTVINCIYGLFLTPEPLDPLNSSLASLMLSDHDAYLSVVKKWVAQNCEKNLGGSQASAMPALVQAEDKACWSCGKTNPSKRCNQCKEAYYCNQRCQKTDWEQRHKRLCVRK